jgi:hypothetical protein
MSKQIRKDGKRIKRCVEELTKEGYVLLHKQGKAISLNPTRSRAIAEYIKKIMKT